jgi:hypothetical protein
MLKKLTIAAVMVCLLGCSAQASTAILEAGPFAIVLDQDLDVGRYGSYEQWQVIGYEPITTREDVKADAYTLKIWEFTLLDKVKKTALMDTNDYTSIEVRRGTRPPEIRYRGFTFTPEPVGNVTVGRLRPIETTLYTGSIEGTYSTKTPYLVAFYVDGISCLVYVVNTDELLMKLFLSRLDVVWKEDLSTYNLTKLWEP